MSHSEAFFLRSSASLFADHWVSEFCQFVLGFVLGGVFLQGWVAARNGFAVTTDNSSKGSRRRAIQRSQRVVSVH